MKRTSLFSKVGIFGIKVSEFSAVLVFIGTACNQPTVRLPGKGNDLRLPGERHFKSLHQLTSGGMDAEAYWSLAANSKSLTFQHKGIGSSPPSCDQIYAMHDDGSDLHRVSNGQGRTTCSYFTPDSSHILFSSTFAYSKECPVPPRSGLGNIWPVYNSYQIYKAQWDGTDLIPLEPAAPKSYNAEATVCHDGSVVFTSDRNGDLDLYRAKLDSLGTLGGVEQITKTLGYDGGAVFSPNCDKIAWRASRPRSGRETEEYQELLKQHLVRPAELEIWTADADGKHAHQVTRIGATSFAPYFTPDGQRVIFSSNFRDPRGRAFDLYLIHTDGTQLERVTYSDNFESYPSFSPDGKKLALTSNRAAAQPHETNILVADWEEGTPEKATRPADDAADRAAAFIRKMSSPEMEGLRLRTPGLALAENTVALLFQEAGLQGFFSAFPSEPGQNFKHRVEIRNSKTGEIDVANDILGVWGDACGKTAPVLLGTHLSPLDAADRTSGLAALAEAIRIITTKEQKKEKSASCYIFGAFAARGTDAEHPSESEKLLATLTKKPKVMFSFEGVGRMESNLLEVDGTDSSLALKELVEKQCANHHLNCPGPVQRRAYLDIASFHAGLLPTLTFSAGVPGDPSRALKNTENLNYTGIIQSSETIAAMAIKVASSTFKLPSRIHNRVHLRPTIEKRD